MLSFILYQILRYTSISYNLNLKTQVSTPHIFLPERTQYFIKKGHLNTLHTNMSERYQSAASVQSGWVFGISLNSMKTFGNEIVLIKSCVQLLQADNKYFALLLTLSCPISDTGGAEVVSVSTCFTATGSVRTGDLFGSLATLSFYEVNRPGLNVRAFI